MKVNTAKHDNIHKNQALEFCQEHAPIVILHQPQLGENVGMVARAMLNCGLSELRLVSPRSDMNMDHAKRTAVKATYVMDNIQIYHTLEEATADIHYLYATTARQRDQTKKIVNPEIMAIESRSYIEKNMKVAYLFGKESVGLSNKEVAFSNAIVTIPLNPAFSSLNLAQSVLICAYEWCKCVNNPILLSDHVDNSDICEISSKQDMESLYADIFQRLEDTSFFNVTNKKQQQENQIRNIFNKIPLSKKETQLLRGIFRFMNN